MSQTLVTTTPTDEHFNSAHREETERRAVCVCVCVQIANDYRPRSAAVSRILIGAKKLLRWAAGQNLCRVFVPAATLFIFAAAPAVDQLWLDIMCSLLWKVLTEAQRSTVLCSANHVAKRHSIKKEGKKYRDFLYSVGFSWNLGFNCVNVMLFSW